MFPFDDVAVWIKQSIYYHAYRILWCVVDIFVKDSEKDITLQSIQNLFV